MKFIIYFFLSGVKPPCNIKRPTPSIQPSPPPPEVLGLAQKPNPSPQHCGSSLTQTHRLKTGEIARLWECMSKWKIWFIFLKKVNKIVKKWMDSALTEHQMPVWKIKLIKVLLKLHKNMDFTPNYKTFQI